MNDDDLEPIFVSVKKAAQMLSLTPATVYARLDQQLIESRYEGKKRLVVLASLREYAANLPDVAPSRTTAP
jgi:hypothetical protein